MKEKWVSFDHAAVAKLVATLRAYEWNVLQNYFERSGAQH
jgi:hypothetical protein